MLDSFEIQSSQSHVFGEDGFLKVAHLSFIYLQLLDYVVSATVHDDIFDEFSSEYFEILVEISSASTIG